MIEIKDKSLCSGCHACYNICPKDAIAMKVDKDGFLYPFVDIERCIECELCKKSCPIENQYSGNEKGRALACINKDEKVKEESSSGGIFSLIAEYVIDCGGAVYGAAFNDDFSVKHIEIRNKDDIGKLRGSKYLQSEIGDIYQKIKKQLEKNELVLFSGTPCQISGLKSFLGREYDNLILLDVICHGVPSPKIWREYIKYREKSVCACTRRTNFRHKKYGWNLYSVRFEFSNRTEYEQIFSKDLFMRGFLANLCLRPSCYNCHSKSLNRESDITIADFWGVENVAPDIYDKMGTSLVFLNSAKGEKIYNKIKDFVIYREVDIDEAVKYNVSAYKSVEKPKNYEKFMSEVSADNFDKIVEKYTKKSLLKRVSNKAKRTIKEVINYV